MSTVYIRLTSHGAGVLQRAPELERLIARATTTARVDNWRADAFRALAADGVSVPAIGAVALRAAVAASGGAPGRAEPPVDAWVCVATPVHFVAGMTSVSLTEDGVLHLDAAEALALAEDFNRVFGGAGARLVANPAAGMLCVFDAHFDVATCDPADLVGGEVFAYQPPGRDAPRLRRLMSEIEMWLFDHAANRIRTAAGRLPVTALWLWGGGGVLTSTPQVQGWTSGRDPLFSALGALSAPGARQAGVAVIEEQPGSAAWAQAQDRWLAPAVVALQDGRIERLDLSAGQRRFSVTRRFGLRFWRRARPWWESFELEVEGKTAHGI